MLSFHMNPVNRITFIGCALTACTLLSNPLVAQLDPEAISWIPKVTTPPLIDGEIDQIWHARAPFQIAKVIDGTVENEADLSAEWYGLYDDDNFYFLIDIHDQFLESEAGSDIWRNDRIEAYFNMDNVKPGGSGHSGDNSQYGFHWNKPDEEFVNNSTWTGVEWAYTTTSYGYITEIKIPFTTLTELNAVQGFSFGFDIAINDNDGFPVYDSVTYWWNSISESEWGNIDGAGTVGLGEPFDGNYPPVVSSMDTQIAFEGTASLIEVSASDANLSDTLTLSATDLPSFVTLQDNGDGTATLTVDGQVGDANIYRFTVTASDGSRDGSTEITLILKDPDVLTQTPKFEAISDFEIDQGGKQTVDVTAIDLDSLTVDITATELPEFATFSTDGDRTATLEFNPGYSVTPQEYAVTLQVEDPDSNVGTITFKVNVLWSEKLTVFYCDPVAGDMMNDGSSESPWNTLQAVFEAGKLFVPGDVIHLRTGYHGEPVVSGANDGIVTIKPEPGATPMLSSLELDASSSHWDVSGLEISRSHAAEFSRKTMVVIGGSHNVVSNCEIFTVPDISEWTLDDWLTKPSTGVHFSGAAHSRLEGSTILNISFGISVDGSSSFCVVRGNRVQNFSGDGMRGTGNDLVFEYNYVADNYNIDANHDDGFQSWSSGEGGIGSGVVYRLTLRGNTIVETTDPDRPFRGSLQGVGCFDGMFEDWVVENNVVIVNHWHGISLYGATNCRIINNTVVDQDMNAEPGPTWITIQPHKKYSSATTPEDKAYYLGSGNLLRNNLTTKISGSTSSGEVDNNREIVAAEFDDTFIGYPFNLRLRAGSPAIDAGTNTGAAKLDADGNIRPLDGDGDSDATVDWGAYEYGSGSQGELDLVEVAGRHYLQMTLDKSALDDGAWYGVQVSSDLTIWNPDPVVPGESSAFEIVENSADRLIIRDKTPTGPSSPRFMRAALKDSE